MRYPGLIPQPTPRPARRRAQESSESSVSHQRVIGRKPLNGNGKAPAMMTLQTLFRHTNALRAPAHARAGGAVVEKKPQESSLSSSAR